MIESEHLEGNGIAMDRLVQLREWTAAQLKEDEITLVPASADASFRRYFRVRCPTGSYIVMDAPPAHERCEPFVHVAQLFRTARVNVPEVYAQDLEHGFLLLGDFGTVTYLDALSSRDPEPLYRDALDALVRMQLASRPGVLPDYNRERLGGEIDLFPQWYVARHLHRELSSEQQGAFDAVRQRILECNLAEPQVYVHRDYHSRNLMLTEPNPGILDFQDAVFGPLSYDLVSLLRDAYVEWPEAQVLDWSIRYWEKARAAKLPVASDFAQFYRDFEWMGVQRHLKVLGIFARLWYRDGKDRYLADMPLVLRYVRSVTERYRELAPLARLLDELHDENHSTQLSF